MGLYHKERPAGLDRVDRMIRRIILFFVLVTLICLFILEVSIPDTVL